MSRRRPTSLAVLTAVVVVLYAPLVFLVVAGINRNPLSTSWQGATGQWYRAMWDDEALRRSVAVSLRLAAVTTIVAVIFGTAMALAMRTSPLVQRWARGTAGLRVATPEIVIATGLAALMPSAGVDFGFRPMVVAHVAYLTAYVVLIVGSRVATLDPALDMAAADLGAGPWRTLWRVILPDLRPAIGAAALLVMAFSLDDVALSLALRGPTDTTLPVYLYSVVQRRVTPAVYAVGTMVVLVGAVLFLTSMALHNLFASTPRGAREPRGRRLARR